MPVSVDTMLRFGVPPHMGQSAESATGIVAAKKTKSTLTLRMFAFRCSLFAVRYSAFAIRYSLFAVLRESRKANREPRLLVLVHLDIVEVDLGDPVAVDPRA